LEVFKRLLVNAGIVGMPATPFISAYLESVVLGQFAQGVELFEELLARTTGSSAVRANGIVAELRAGIRTGDS